MRDIWALVRGQCDFTLLVTAGLLSLTGDWILAIGMAYYVYDLTGSTLASAGMLLAVYVPSILLGSFAGVFVDRWNRKTTMILANLLMAAGLLPLLFIRDPSQVWVAYAVAAFEGVVELFFTPAERALLPRLVPDADLVTANALNGQIRDVSRLVGSAGGGFAVSAAGLTGVALLDATSFVASACLIARIRVSGRPIDAAETPIAALATSKLNGVLSEWLSGLRVAVTQPVLRVVLLFVLITTIGEGIMGTLFVPFVRDVLNGNGTDYGLIVSVQAVGGIAGGIAAASLGRHLSPVWLFGGGAVAFGFLDLVLFLYPLVVAEIWPAIICMILVGLPGAITISGYTTLLQRNTADSYRGRLFGALGAVQGVSVVVGTLSAGFLGESVGIIPILAVQGVGYVVAGAVSLIALTRYGVENAEKPDPAEPSPGLSTVSEAAT